MPAHLLEGYFQLPAHHKPTEDLLWIGIEVGTQEGLCLEISVRIAHHNLAACLKAFKMLFELLFGVGSACSAGGGVASSPC
jgi:hypothetical protein